MWEVNSSRNVVSSGVNGGIGPWKLLPGSRITTNQPATSSRLMLDQTTIRILRNLVERFPFGILRDLSGQGIGWRPSWPPAQEVGGAKCCASRKTPGRCAAHGNAVGAVPARRMVRLRRASKNSVSTGRIVGRPLRLPGICRRRDRGRRSARPTTRRSIRIFRRPLRRSFARARM